MQAVIELLTTMVVWAASVTFAHFGIEVDLRAPEPERVRVIERTRSPAPTHIVSECPEAKSAILPGSPAAMDAARKA